MNGECIELLDDLSRELSRRRENQSACLATRSSEKPVKNRKQKRRRLAAPGGSACKYIAPVERRWNCFSLNGSRANEAELFDASEEIAIEMKY
jgi:hypothetical protein